MGKMPTRQPRDIGQYTSKAEVARKLRAAAEWVEAGPENELVRLRIDLRFYYIPRPDNDNVENED
jgi:hypothetical protein